MLRVLGWVFTKLLTNFLRSFFEGGCFIAKNGRDILSQLFVINPYLKKIHPYRTKIILRSF